MSGNAAKGKCPVGEGSAASAQEWDLPVYGFLANFGARRFPKGNEGKRVSSGYNRRRRLATGRSGKQQAERTAVRTAPIVCPEESPLVRPQAHTPATEGPDAPTAAREQGLQPYGALTLFFRWRKKSVQKKASGTATPEAAHVAMHCGQALRCAWAWLRASWLSAISGASRPSASLGRGLRSAGTERLDDPNKFGSSNSGLRAGTV